MSNIQTNGLMSPEIQVPPFSHILFYALNVLILLVAVFFLAVPSVIKTLKAAEPLSPEAQVMLQEAHIPMYLETSGRIRLGEDFDVVLHLNSIVRQVESVDVVLDYNPEYVKLHPGAIIGSESFPKITDIDSSKYGQLRFRALADQGRPFQGEDEVARISFNATASGNTSIMLQHDAGITEASRVSSGGFDVLEQTVALQVEIGPGE